MIDLINIIKLGYLGRKVFVKTKFSNKKLIFLSFLYKQGLIKRYYLKNNYIIIFLRYVNNQPLFKDFNFISKKGYRKYVTFKNLKNLNQVAGTNTLILSSSFGYITNFEAMRLHIGGELLYKIVY